MATIDTAARATNQTNHEEFFVGDGEMAALMRSLDWSKTPLGSTAAWPQSLKTTVRIVLTSRYAMWMAWGKDLTFFCNDAYRPTLGVKHLWALGTSAREVWAEIWPDIGPRIEKVLHTGEATWDEALLLFLERSGYPEETYHTFSYSPLANDDGQILGMLCVVTEETERIIGERRMALLREVGSALASTQTIEEVFAGLARCIEADSLDLPFTLTYLFDAEGSTARLARATNIPDGHPIAVPRIGLEASDTPWPLQALLTDHVPVQMDNLGTLFESLPSGSWDKPPQQAIVVPIAHQGQERPAGFLVAALNPYRQFDSAYMGFVTLLAGQIASSLANARAYEEEKRRAEALAELDRAKTAFFSNVSHEFRTPLTLMLGPLEDALAEEPPALEGESLQTVHRNGMRLLKLVNTLLDFSRIEAGRVQASYEAIDLSAYTLELASVFRSAVERAGMQLLLDCPPLSEAIFVDRDMWEKIVLNLLSNAFKFTFAGEIAVTLREQEEKAVLSVRDTGMGIPEEQLPSIFERFHRVEGAPARTHEGTGIGLALVQELVRLHGGTVAVESAYGVGTTFIVSIPLGKTHLPPERIAAGTTLASTALRAEAFVEEALRWLPDKAQPGISASYGGSTPSSTEGPIESQTKSEAEETDRACILLADDNADMREYVRRLLSSRYEVIAVADGAEALRAARDKKPDLVLSDIMMPRLDGFGLLRELRTEPHTASIPVILLSARAGEEARIEGLTAGADDYLIKPFSARELLARVSSHLELARVRQEAEQAIHEREERFRTLADNIAQLVWMADGGGAIVWYNKRWFDYTGMTLEEMQGSGWEKVHHPDHLERVVANISECFRTGTFWEDTFPLRGKDGQYRWFLSRAVPIRDEAGRVVRWFGTNTDVTEQRQMQRKIEEMNVRLQRAMTETHHRVKNNLQLMSALIDMKRASDGESVPMSELERLGANVRALGIIHDILTQESRAENDQETLSTKTLLERLTHVLGETTGDRPLKFAFDDAQLAGRQTTTLALVTNELVSNALKHGHGETEIYFRVQGDIATLEVGDDGPGFPADFNSQFASKTGLELVENIVEWDLRGQITYGNRPEGGARITVTFPIAVPPTGAPRTPEHERA